MVGLNGRGEYFGSGFFMWFALFLFPSKAEGYRFGVVRTLKLPSFSPQP